MFPRFSDNARTLIDLARQAIASAVLKNCPPPEPALSDEVQAAPGVFVTLHRNGKLRGCVGQVESIGPLNETVARIAVDAALRDPRFSPVTLNELDHLEIEISLLSPLELVRVEWVVAGKHGVVVDNGRLRGVLLPQVAAERQWTAMRLVEETCSKAGLPSDAWKHDDTRIYAFTVEVLTETRAEAAAAENPAAPHSGAAAAKSR